MYTTFLQVLQLSTGLQVQNVWWKLQKSEMHSEDQLAA